MCPNSVVLSFDVDPIARRRQRQLAELNSVKNLEIGKYCSHRSLSETLCSHSLLFCDIEGFEYELLDPERVNELRVTDILVEIHDYACFSSLQVKHALIQRFSKSHHVSIIQSRSRDAAEWIKKRDSLHKIENSFLSEALNEHRNDGQEWLWMKAK